MIVMSTIPPAMVCHRLFSKADCSVTCNARLILQAAHIVRIKHDSREVPSFTVDQSFTAESTPCRRELTNQPGMDRCPCMVGLAFVLVIACHLLQQGIVAHVSGEAINHAFLPWPGLEAATRRVRRQSASDIALSETRLSTKRIMW